MKLRFQPWRPGQLLLVWSVYWLGLTLVSLRTAIVAGWRMSQQAGGHGTVSGNMGDGILTATIIDNGRTAWAGSISVLNLALLIAVPPLLLWLIWFAASARASKAGAIDSKKDSRLKELQSAGGRIETSTSPTPKRRAREES